MTPPLRIALGEYDTGWHDARTSLARAAGVVRAAERAGAAMVVLPEMCTAGFTMEPEYAERLDGASVTSLGEMAAAAKVRVLAGVALREAEGSGERLVNAAVLFGPHGRIESIYRKQRVFAYAGEHEVFTPGRETTTVVVNGVRIALFVCYDLRFPELFRAAAPMVDAMIVIANWPVARRAHWDVLLRARAIENQCYVIGVNRTGEGGGLVYDGGSAAYGPGGEPVATVTEGIACADVDPARVRAQRDEYPFLADITSR